MQHFPDKLLKMKYTWSTRSGLTCFVPKLLPENDLNLICVGSYEVLTVWAVREQFFKATNVKLVLAASTNRVLLLTTLCSQAVPTPFFLFFFLRLSSDALVKCWSAERAVCYGQRKSQGWTSKIHYLLNQRLVVTRSNWWASQWLVSNLLCWWRN